MKSGLYDDIVADKPKKATSGLYDDIVTPAPVTRAMPAKTITGDGDMGGTGTNSPPFNPMAGAGPKGLTVTPDGPSAIPGVGGLLTALQTLKGGQKPPVKAVPGIFAPGPTLGDRDKAIVAKQQPKQPTKTAKQVFKESPAIIRENQQRVKAQEKLDRQNTAEEARKNLAFEKINAHFRDKTYPDGRGKKAAEDIAVNGVRAALRRELTKEEDARLRRYLQSSPDQIPELSESVVTKRFAERQGEAGDKLQQGIRDTLGGGLFGDIVGFVARQPVDTLAAIEAIKDPESTTQEKTGAGALLAIEAGTAGAGKLAKGAAKFIGGPIEETVNKAAKGISGDAGKVAATYDTATVKAPVVKPKTVAVKPKIPATVMNPPMVAAKRRAGAVVVPEPKPVAAAIPKPAKAPALEGATREGRVKELLQLHPDDPRIDPFHDKFDPRLEYRIKTELGHGLEDDRNIGDILYEARGKTQLTEGADDYIQDHLKRALKGEGQVNEAVTVWVKKKLKYGGVGWYQHARQKFIAGTARAVFPEDVRAMLDDYAASGFSDPEYRITKSGDTDNAQGAARLNGSRTLSEWTLKDQGGKAQVYPHQLIQGFLEQLGTNTADTRARKAIEALGLDDVKYREAVEHYRANIDPEFRLEGEDLAKEAEAPKAPPVEPPAPPKARTAQAFIPNQGVAVQKRILASIRKFTGLDELDEPARVKMADAAKRAGEKGYHKPDEALRLADEVLTNKKPLDHEQTLGMGAALDDLIVQHEKLADEYLRTAEKGGDQVLAGRLTELRDKIGKLTEAGNVAGTEWGRSGVARQAVMKADGSFAGILARRQKITGRSLSEAEIETARIESQSLKNVVDAQAKRIAELEKTLSNSDAQRVLTTARRTVTKAKLAQIDQRLVEAKSRLSAKWAESAPKGGLKASVFGVEIALEQAARLASIAPDVLEVARLYAAKGFVSLADNTRQVVSYLKGIGIDLSENDVAAVLAGKVQDTVKTARKVATDYEGLKAEARRAFLDVAEEQKRKLKEINQLEREKGKAAAAKAREDYRKEVQEARKAEAEFWRNVREEEAAWEKGQTVERRQERKEYERWWKASIGGQKAGLLNRIDDLQEKLGIYADEGFLPGRKSRLDPPKDPALQELRVKEAALRNRMDKADTQLRIQAERDAMNVLGKAWDKYNPFSVSRSVVASFDNSFPFNQGSMALLSDPKAWFKGFKSSFKGLTQEATDRLAAEMRADTRNWERAQAANLFEEGADIADIYGAELRIPGVMQSQRMYEIAGRATRFELFKAWTRMAETSGMPLTVEDLKAIASEVKTWTGQGEWGKGAQHISKPFFALRYRLSQFEVAMGAPLKRTYQHAKKSGNWGPFKMMLGRYAQGYATAAITYTLAAESLNRFGPKNSRGEQMFSLEYNPVATNFGRLEYRKGGTTQVLDLLPPAMRFAGLASRVIAGKRITAKGNVNDASEFLHKGLRSEMIGDWMTSGLSPILGSTWNAWTAQSHPERERFGKSFDFTAPSTFGIPKAYWSIGEGFLPIPVQNAKELWENEELSTAEKIIATGLMPFLQQNTQK